MFTVAALVITDVFPEKTQALGGAVFQTLAQFGTSLGLAIMASISNSVTDHSEYKVKTSTRGAHERISSIFLGEFWVDVAGVCNWRLGLEADWQGGLEERVRVNYCHRGVLMVLMM